jgi:hypothetical protein
MGVAAAAGAVAEAQPRQRGAQRQRAQHAALEPEARGLERAQPAQAARVGGAPQRGREHALHGADLAQPEGVLVPRGRRLDRQLGQEGARGKGGLVRAGTAGLALAPAGPVRAAPAHAASPARPPLRPPPLTSAPSLPPPRAKP